MAVIFDTPKPLLNICMAMYFKIKVIYTTNVSYWHILSVLYKMTYRIFYSFLYLIFNFTKRWYNNVTFNLFHLSQNKCYLCIVNLDCCLNLDYIHFFSLSLFHFILLDTVAFNVVIESVSCYHFISFQHTVLVQMTNSNYHYHSVSFSALTGLFCNLLQSL